MADVIVAGGGPAGSAAALVLARAGVETLVIERAQFPRTKACGEYLNSGAIARLRELGLHETLAPLASPIEGIRLSGNGVRTELRFSQGAWALPRAQLDDALLRAAVGAGARVLHAHVEEIDSSHDRVSVTVRTPDGETQTIGALALVGADGAHSLVSKKCGLTASPRGVQRFAIGGHYAGFVGLEAFVEMFVEGSGYFAVNPFDAARANVMVIVRENELAARRNDVDDFIRSRADRLSGSSARFRNARLEGRRIAVGPLAHRTTALTRDRVLLAGDAAGFLDPFTGQGVYLALRGGIAAGDAIAAALAAPAKRATIFQAYENDLSREMHDRYRLASLVRSLLRWPALSRRAARNVARDPSRVRVLVDAVAASAPAAPALKFATLLGLVA